MIVFELDNVLCDTSHRRHFIDPRENNDYTYIEPPFNNFFHKDTSLFFEPNYQAYDNACDGDDVIHPVMGTLKMFLHCNAPIQIWISRCKSQFEKTVKWIIDSEPYSLPRSWFNNNMKMRPVGNTEPAWKLKEMWLDSFVRENRTVDFVFDADEDSINMWRRRHVFCFDCRQT